METTIGVEGKWAVDASPSLALALARRLDIADKLAGERWQLKVDEDGGMTGHLRRGPVRVVLESEEHTDHGTAVHYKLSVKRFGVTITAAVEMECEPADDGGSIVATRLHFDDSIVLRFVPRGTVDQRLFFLQQALLLTYEQALEALSADREAALAKLPETDRELLLSCLPTG